MIRSFFNVADGCTELVRVSGERLRARGCFRFSGLVFGPGIGGNLRVPSLVAGAESCEVGKPIAGSWIDMGGI